MSRIMDDNYYQISGWMLNRLGLKGTELQVFSIIYGFSQDGESMFGGSINYLCDWLRVSRPTIIKALKDLVGKDYIIKDSLEINNVTFNRYKANLQVISDLRGSKETLLGSKETLLNNNNNNNTNIVSKDTILDTVPGAGTAETKQSSGKLFSSAKSQTRKSSVQKTNNFITTCQREAVKKEFHPEVLRVLDDYFRMLAELNCLLPAVSIAEQLSHLAKVPEDKKIFVVKSTIAHGWKSLQYEAEAATTGGAFRSSFVDTASPNTFTATPEEEKNGDWKKQVPEDHIF